MYNKNRRLLFPTFNSKIILLFLVISFFISLLPTIANSKPLTEAEKLVFASWDSDLTKIKSLVSEDVAINAKAGPGLTAYHCAKLRGNETILEWLVENGANQEIKMPDRNQIADMIFTRNSSPDSPGGALAVVRNESIVHTACYGLANLEHDIPITQKTVFDAGSITKQFVGMAIAMLVQQEKISLEDDIRKYIPELHDFEYTIKIKHLLHHTSGLRDTAGSLSLAGWSLDDVITFDHILSLVFNQKGLNFEPGTEHLYSNSGYALLAELVQRISGKTFREWAETNLLQALQMTNSHVHDDYRELVPGKGYGYILGQDKKYSAAPNNASMIGPSGLYTSIVDMAKWAINFENHNVGGDEVFDLMYQQGTLNNGEQIAYANGLEIKEYRGAKTIGHGGGWAGFTSLIMYFPEHNFSAVVMYNINSNVYGNLFDIADIYLGEKLDVKSENATENKSIQELTVSDDTLDKYIGTYKVFPAFYITISRDGSQLMALETNKEKSPLQAISKTEFRLDSWNQTLLFNTDDSGRVADFSFLGKTCPRVEEGTTITFTPISEEFTGDYYCEELDVRYTIDIEEDKLIAKHRRHGTAGLTPAWKDNFRCDWWFMRSVEFSRDENGLVDGFSVTQWQSRNHRFIKMNNNKANILNTYNR